MRPVVDKLKRIALLMLVIETDGPTDRHIS